MVSGEPEYPDVFQYTILGLLYPALSNSFKRPGIKEVSVPSF